MERIHPALYLLWCGHSKMCHILAVSLQSYGWINLKILVKVIGKKKIRWEGWVATLTNPCEWQTCALIVTRSLFKELCRQTMRLTAANCFTVGKKNHDKHWNTLGCLDQHVTSTFAWTLHLSKVISPENFMMMWWKERCEKGWYMSEVRCTPQNFHMGCMPVMPKNVPLWVAAQYIRHLWIKFAVYFAC